MTEPILSRPSPAAEKLEALRQHFPGAIDTDGHGRIRVNTAVLQQALDPAGVQVDHDCCE